MTSNSADAIHPYHAALASTVVIRVETKLKSLENDADMAEAQQQGLLDRLAFHALTKRLLDAHLVSIDAHYIETENELKAVILSFSGGDESLFAEYVPARPADLLPV